MERSPFSAAMRGLAAVLVLAVSQFAHAHAYPKKQLPAAGSIADTSLKEVSIEFDDALEPAFSSIAVTDASGKSVVQGKPVFDPKDPKHMEVAVQGLTAGTYSVSWVAVAADGHRTQGHYTFNVK